jgi:Ca-activated chloride channel family protein
MLPDYYTILGVQQTASTEEIKQAFRSLARQYHPDMQPGSASAAANKQFHALHEAYRVLTSAELRAKYDQQRARQHHQGANSAAAAGQAWDTPAAQPPSRTPTPATLPGLELGCTLSHSQVPVYPQEQLIYALSELIPISDGQVVRKLPLNLCLAIDRSSSMRGEKLHAVKQSLRTLIERLLPGDILSIIAFDNRAEVIVRAEQKQLPDVLISTVERLSERGGTEIAQGLEAALEEIRRFSKDPMVSHLILLTDGRTYGDDARCLELAFQARQQGISITALGIGTEWNEQLLDQIADLSEGMSDYLASASDIAAALEERVDTLRNTLATNVKIALELEGGVRLRRVTRVIPDMSELMDATPAANPGLLAREAELEVGIVSAASQGCSLALLWEIILPANVSGRYTLGRITLQYDIPYAKLSAQRTSERLVVEFVDAHTLTHMNTSRRVNKVLEYITAYRLQSKAHLLAQQGEHTAASHLMQTAALRLRGANHADLAKQAQEQADQLAQQQTPPRASILKLKYATKNLNARRV